MSMSSPVDRNMSVSNSEMMVVDNNLVPDPWKTLFSNDEWLMHDIVVKSTYGFLVIAILAHTLVYLWKPWLPNI